MRLGETTVFPMLQFGKIYYIVRKSGHFNFFPLVHRASKLSIEVIPEPTLGVHEQT